MPDFQNALNRLDANTFASTMGQAVWLMTLSLPHREIPIREIERLIAPALLLKQFRLYSKGKQPVAFLTWATVSYPLKEQLEAGGTLHDLKDWRSGPNVVVLDCISPFQPPETFRKKFLDSLSDAIVESEEE